MKMVSVHHIEGPNVYLYKPILVARVHLEDYTEKESFEFPGFVEALLTHLPGLHEHHCAKGEPGGFVERLYGGTYFGHIVEHVTIELATLLGLDVHYGKTVYADGPGVYDIVMECKNPDCQAALLREAFEMVRQLTVDPRAQVDVEAVLKRGREALQRTQLGPSTQAIVDACRRRDIPVRRIGTGSLLELGYGVHRQRIEATITDQTSCVAVDIASDKDQTKDILREGGIPVPDGAIVYSEDEAMEWLEWFAGPVVVKPSDGRQGQGVTLNVTSLEEMKQAYAWAKDYGSSVIVEQQVVGENVRLLVVNGRCVAAALRQPASVVGDGVHTIRALIDQANADERRGTGHEKPLTKIYVDPAVEKMLAACGLTLDSVPSEGTRVVLRESANLSTGGEAIDVTREIDKSYMRLAERGARLIGLDVCGMDMVIEDIHEPASDENCAVIEVNAAPGIRMHQHPSQGVPRDVADAIVESMFPRGNTGRIPIISITGTNGKTTTSRLIAHAFKSEGKTVGLTTTGGVYLNDELIQPGDTTGPRSARMILSDPSVEVAVLETARGGIVRGGLAYDKADVAVMTNISLDHVGQDYLDSIEDLIHVKSLVAECVHDDGTVVLNADDEHLVKLSERLRSNIVFISSHANNPVVRRHIARGGTAFYVENGQFVEANGSLKRVITSVANVPLTMRGTIGFHVENTLLSMAALRAAGMSRRAVANSLGAYAPEENQGRCMIYQLPSDKYVILDYAHNPAGFERIGEWVSRLPHHSLLGIVGVPGDRADHVVELAGEVLAPLFDAFIVKEDADKRGRREGEVAGILQRTLAASQPGKPVVVKLDEKEALKEGLARLERGDIACFFYEKWEPLEQILIQNGAKRVNDITYQTNASYAMM